MSTVILPHMEGPESERQFLAWLRRWYFDLPGADHDPKAWLGIVDMLEGFTRKGPLASPRNAALIPYIAELVAIHRGNLRYLNDEHAENSPEFQQFGPHCKEGSDEAVLCPELWPILANNYHQEPNSVGLWYKNALSAFMLEWDQKDWKIFFDHDQVFIFVGNCTDLCILHNAMAIKMAANALNRHDITVRVYANLVDTYDMPVDNPYGVTPHNGDLMHLFGLYQLYLNGVEVVNWSGK